MWVNMYAHAQRKPNEFTIRIRMLKDTESTKELFK